MSLGVMWAGGLPKLGDSGFAAADGWGAGVGSGFDQAFGSEPHGSKRAEEDAAGWGGGGLVTVGIGAGLERLKAEAMFMFDDWSGGDVTLLGGGGGGGSEDANPPKSSSNRSLEDDVVGLGGAGAAAACWANPKFKPLDGARAG